ncbi:MAG: phosphoadenosine phosphosulfate reductase family protein [Candidatus Babeliales bacterium]|jgi:3'-phosphoadenosine 5'-phosphosulfate sulfotransferase (PAPS reductase)/FAD synthetase
MPIENLLYLTISELRQRQNFDLEQKIELTKVAIRQFYDFFDGQVYVSFSGGKDSTVLLDIVRSEYPDVKAAFLDTGLEYKLIRDFVKTIPNVEWIKPKMNFIDVIKKYGYPVISKEQAHYIQQYRESKSQHTRDMRWNGINGRFKISEKWKFLCNAPFKISDHCCYVLKKYPAMHFNKVSQLRPFIGTMATNSSVRERTYLREGCNSFSKIGSEHSTPLGFWNEEDIWQYIKEKHLCYSCIYDKGLTNTGCAFCMFGIMHDKGRRFTALKQIQPELYNYCMNKLKIHEVLDYINANLPEKDRIIYE